MTASVFVARQFRRTIGPAFLIALVLSPKSSWADDPTPEQILDKFLAVQQDELNGLKKQIEDDQASLKQAGQRKDKVQAQALSQQIASEKAKLKAMLAAKPPKELPIPTIKKLQAGATGKLAYIFSGAKVLQVTGPNEMLVRVTLERGTVVELVNGRPQPRIDEREGTIKVQVPTEGITDDSVVDLNKFSKFWYCGTTTYSTTDGASKTALLLRPIDLTEVQKLWDGKHREKSPPKPFKPADAPAKYGALACSSSYLSGGLPASCSLAFTAARLPFVLAGCTK